MTPMEITTTQTDGTTILGISGDLRIATVADAKLQLVAALAACDEIQVDLSEVGQCDTAGIQLLLMACASARAKGKRWMPKRPYRLIAGYARPYWHFRRKPRIADCSARNMAMTVVTADHAV